jgi:peptide/nickel transport system permease protein
LKFHVHNRFFRFLWGDGEMAKGILRGDLGISYTTGQPVELQFSYRWWHSIALGLLALLFSTLMAGCMAFALGLRKQDSRWLPMVLLAFSAVPTFLAGTALLWIFANPDLFQWFPSGGMEPAGGFSNHTHGWSGTWFKMSFWILPLISLSYGLVVSFSLPWTQAVKNILAQPFFQTARAKGLGLYKAFFAHALPQLLPLMATMVSQALPALIGGSVVIETLFTWPGLGKLTIDAVFAKDQPVLVAMLTLSGILTLTIFLGSNLLQKWLDPRIENHG